MARTPATKKAAAKTPAAKKTSQGPQYSHRYCNARPTVPRDFGPGMTADRARAINVFGDKWVNGTELSY